jgi:hypothetical protein
MPRFVMRPDPSRETSGRQKRNVFNGLIRPGDNASRPLLGRIRNVSELKGLRQISNPSRPSPLRGEENRDGLAVPAFLPRHRGGHRNPGRSAKEEATA